MIRLPRAALALFAFLALATSAAALTAPRPPLAHAASSPAPRLKQGEWPQARSDLRADPNTRFGALPNGMRYAIMRNATPPGQASLRLVIRAGSLMESDDQQGLAHFLEHMAFNGSKAVQDRGEMVKVLQRLGLAFGADTNAQTGFDATTYKLDLPKADAPSIDTALKLLREVAGNLLLRQADVDSERGVILSEERVRDTPSYRIAKSRLGFLMAGQRPPRRWPIGLVPVIQNARRAQIADFYDRYYRPERATLIVIGDFDPAAMEAKIRAGFSDWRGAPRPGRDPDLGPVQRRGAQFRVAVEPGDQTSVQLSWVAAPDLAVDNTAKRRREWVQRLGLAVLNRRLSTLARQQNPPFITAISFHGDQLRAEEISALSVTAEADHWQAALAAADAELRRAVRFGVRPDELAREITEQRAALKLAADGASTRRTPDLAEEVVGSLADDEVDTSPADDLTLFDAVAKDLTAEQVSGELTSMFSTSGPLVFLSAPTAIAGGEATLARAFADAEKVPVAAPAQPKQVDWPYASFGPPGKVAARQDVADLGVQLVRFENGVRLTIKPTKFRDNQVLVRVRVGDGLAGLPPDRQSMAWAGQAFAEGGLKQISADDAERALAGKTYGMTFAAEDDAFSLTGDTRTSDLATQLQELAAYVTDPGWRPEAFERIKTYGETLEDQYNATDSGVLARDLSGLLHGGDRRWTFPNKGEIAGETLSDLQGQVSPALASGPIEVIVVGDVTPDAAIDAVARTFGALPRRPDPAPPAPPAHVPSFPAPVAQPIVETHTGRADQAVAFIAWPTTDFFADPRGARVNIILGEVLELRLLDVLRLKEGVTYSPAAGSNSSRVWPGLGFVNAYVEEPPDKTPAFFADLQSIAAELRTTDVTPDVLERAKKPRIEALEKSMATNEYWRDALAGAQADPRRLDALRTAEPQLTSVTAADVRKAAQKWLRDEAAWKLVVRPKGG